MLNVEHVRELAERLASVGEAAPGTEAERRAATIAREELERAGLSVEEQSFACASWSEESVELYVDGRRVAAVAMPPTPSGYVEGELTHVGEGANISARGLEGRVALVGMTSEDPDYVAAQYALLVKAGADAVVFYDFAPRTLRRIVVGLFTGYSCGPGLPPPIPAVAVRREDAIRLLNGGRYAQLAVKTRYSEEARSMNLIAYGGGEPKVLVGAHIDRWLSGAADDAVGSALVLLLSRELSGHRGLAFVLFGAEEYGAPHFNPWYWLWGSRKLVERLSSSGELEELVAVINLDVVARRPLTISASGPEFREAARALVGDAAEYELDSPYFDSFSFSSAGVASTTVHSLWRYIDHYHSDSDVLDLIDWQAVALAGSIAARLAGELAERGYRFFKYDAWRLELLERLDRASKLLSPPAKLVELTRSLEVDEVAARRLRREVIKVVRDGEWVEPSLLRCSAFPELLVVDDWELIERVGRGEEHFSSLAKLRQRWTVGRVQSLPSIPLHYALPSLQRREEALGAYLAAVKSVAKAWLEQAYEVLAAQLGELVGGAPA